MTVRENLHQLIDALPEDRLDDVLDYLNLVEDDDTLTPEEQEAVERGLEDIRQGRTISLEEFKQINDL